MLGILSGFFGWKKVSSVEILTLMPRLTIKIVIFFINFSITDFLYVGFVPLGNFMRLAIKKNWLHFWSTSN